MENRLSVKDVSKALYIHLETTERLAKDKVLDSITEGSEIQFEKDAIEAFKNSPELSHYQPDSILKKHSLLIDGEQSLPSELVDMLNGFTEEREFSYLLKAANVYKIFGSQLKSLSLDEYSEIVRTKSLEWMDYTLVNLQSVATTKNDKFTCEHMHLKLSVGMGAINRGIYKDLVFSIVYHGKKEDIVLIGTLQGFYEIDKGLILMSKKHAQSFFNNFKEIPVVDFARKVKDGTVYDFIEEYNHETNGI